jgi:hypothetical protein
MGALLVFPPSIRCNGGGAKQGQRYETRKKKGAPQRDGSINAVSGGPASRTAPRGGRTVRPAKPVPARRKPPTKKKRDIPPPHKTQNRMTALPLPFPRVSSSFYLFIFFLVVCDAMGRQKRRNKKNVERLCRARLVDRCRRLGRRARKPCQAHERMCTKGALSYYPIATTFNGVTFRILTMRLAQTPSEDTEPEIKGGIFGTRRPLFDVIL